MVKVKLDRCVFYFNVACVVEMLKVYSCRGREKGLDPVKLAPSNLLLTVPRQYLCCGSLMLHVVVSTCLQSRAKVH